MGGNRLDVDYYDGEMEQYDRKSSKENRRMREAKAMAKKKRRSGKY